MKTGELPRLADSLTEGNLPAARFRRQWLLRRGPGDPPPHFSARTVGPDWTLHFHPDLGIEEHQGAHCTLLILGLAVPHAGGDWARSVLHGERPEETALEEALVDLAGTYAVLLLRPSAPPTIYTDPAGMMGIYYGEGYAASCPGLIPDRRRSEEVDRQYQLRGTDDWYAGSLTPFEGARYLLANHSLDPETQRIERFWPRDGGFPARADEEAFSAACTALRQVAHGILDRRPALVSLTGGQDSRVTLAALGDRALEAEYFTIAAPGVKPCDLELSRELASRMDLTHYVLDTPPSPAWATEAYDEISAGLARGARREILGACRHLASPSYVHVSGNLGAITKSYFWHAPNPTQVRERALAKEFIQKAPCIRAGIREWLDSVPPSLPAPTVYNLMYLEQRGGRWMGIGETAANLFYESTSVFASRRFFEYVCSMSTRLQYGGRLLRMFVDSLRPELQGIPYCRVTRNWGTFLPKGLKSWIRGIRRP